MKHLFFLLFLYNTILFAQQKDSVVLSSNDFTYRDGYLISNPFDAQYDSDGWLWILGRNRGTNPYIFSDNEIIIQRFDGANFFSLKIPNTSGKKIKDGLFFKDKKGFYLKLFFKTSDAQLFHIDTQTLKFSSVDAYNKLKKEFIISNEYQVGDTTRLLISSKDKIYSASLDHLELNFIDSLSFVRPTQPPFVTNVISTDQFSIVNLVLNHEILLLDAHGKFNKKKSTSNFVNLEGEQFYPNDIHNFLKVNNQYYFYIADYENVFNAQNGEFKEVAKSARRYKLYREFKFNEDFTKAYTKKKSGEFSEFKLYEFNSFKPKLLATIKFGSSSKTAFKNLGEDLVILNGEKLSVYFFNKSKIKTFLKGKSVRTIKQIHNTNYIISTDEEGLYLLDIESDTAQKINFPLEQKKFSDKYAPDIIVEDDKLIIRNHNDFYTLNPSYDISLDQTGKIVVEEMIKIKDTIFMKDQGGFVYKYNIKDSKPPKTQNTYILKVKEFATDGSSIYAITSDGLLEYVNGSVKLYNIENENAESLLSIYYSDTYGVLVSTKLGELYSFNTSTKKLEFIYDDQYNAAIVGVVEDKDQNLWMNTHSGIVSFNPSTKKIVRYGLKDGLYELKGNQHSTYIDSLGNLFMGSSNGLSFLNLTKLSRNKLDVQPRFSSISFFNSAENRWEINTSPQFLKKTKEIILPSEYRRFSVNASVFESFNPQDLNYRFRLFDTEMESEWYPTYPGKELLYANLAPGKYSLQLEALDTFNNKIGETIELTVISEQVFYKTWWFITLLLLISVSILIYLFNQYRIKQQLFAKNEIALNEASVKNDMMLEIHHRIKNNLQIVSGFLEMQMADSDDRFLKSVLENSQGRIESIAGIHELLYNTDHQNKIVVKENVDRILNYYKKIFLFEIEYHVDIDSSIMSIDQMTPFSIMFNELISNSCKHAFDQTDCPKITIRFHKQHSMYIFEYYDNGDFKNEDSNANTMGLKIVTMMNKQLKGTLKIDKDTHFHLTAIFPINGQA